MRVKSHPYRKLLAKALLRVRIFLSKTPVIVAILVLVFTLYSLGLFYAGRKSVKPVANSAENQSQHLQKLQQGLTPPGMNPSRGTSPVNQAQRIIMGQVSDLKNGHFTVTDKNKHTTRIVVTEDTVILGGDGKQTTVRSITNGAKVSVMATGPLGGEQTAIQIFIQK